MDRSRKMLSVRAFDMNVGTLAMMNDGRIAFEYDGTWIEEGFSLNPFSLPLQKGIFVPDNMNFDGLHGIFADSLPDAWGRLLQDRLLRNRNIDLADITMLDRLAMIGKNGKGALEYYPEYELTGKECSLNIDELAKESEKLLSGNETPGLDELFRRGGSSGGARPKANINVDGEEWIVKFQYSKDMKDSGIMEYEYSLCARECGIEMAETRLFDSEITSGYFGTKRFDRPKCHMASVAALLELDFEIPSLDYMDLFKLTKIITRNDEDIRQMYLRMCFNVFAVNQDDHAKNFMYIYSVENMTWRLAPAYDLTYLITAYGEHTTSVKGKGRGIDIEDLVKVGVEQGLKKEFCIDAASMVKEKTKSLLGKYCKQNNGK